MYVKPIDSVSFQIYQGHKKTAYGEHTWGKFKGYNIEVYIDKKDNTKLQYVSDNLRKWVQSKLIYFQKGIKRITRSRAL